MSVILRNFARKNTDGNKFEKHGKLSGSSSQNHLPDYEALL